MHFYDTQGWPGVETIGSGISPLGSPDALHQAVTLLAHLMGQCPGIVPRPA